MITRAVAQLNMGHMGVSTEAEFVQDLRKNSTGAQLQLLTMQMADFLFADPKNFTYPALGSGEEAVCQPFISTQLRAMLSRTKYVLASGVFKFIDRWKKCKDELILYTTELVDAHSRSSFGSRKPDIAGFDGTLRGPQAITLFGDVKGCAAASDSPFPDAQIGHVLDMGRVLLSQHQLWRTYIYVFLTDGVRFVFFKITRDSAALAAFRYDMSAVYIKERGWQVRALQCPVFVEMLDVVFQVVWYVVLCYDARRSCNT